MADGDLIFNDAAALAFPRYPGTPGDATAIAWLEKRFRELGLETELQWFTYDLGPAQRALRAVLVASAVLVFLAGFMTARSPTIGLILLLAAGIPGAAFLAWSPWFERLYRRQGRTRTANVIGNQADPKAQITFRNPSGAFSKFHDRYGYGPGQIETKPHGTKYNQKGHN